jgi:glycosyltransferase involved in cell wall biosynthesis
MQGRGPAPSTVGIVAIGRNEGDRLTRCLESVKAWCSRLVYVDSGSTDGSLSVAAERAAAVVNLDMTQPFTAARARNAGFERLIQLFPDLDHVFFVDGDCEVDANWLDIARHFLDSHADVAVVAGCRRERYPEKSVYNLLIDMEWREAPFGDVKMCGGDAMMRVDALRQVQGYRADLICGEEPELCVRLRQRGWRIWRLDEPMTLHDAAMYRFGQWWARQVRAGYGFAEGASIHGDPPERHFVAESRRALLWGLFLPVGILVLCLLFGWWGALLLFVYPLQFLRLVYLRRHSGRSRWVHSATLLLGKFAEVVGHARFLSNRLRGVRARLIEYK